MPLFFIILLTIAEIVLVVLVITFFARLKKSEQTVLALQKNQEELLEKVYRNASLEQELVATFTQRQEMLTALLPKLETRIETLQKLISQAEGISHSPQFLREVILNARKKGQPVEQIAKNMGLSKDEVEIILRNI